MQFVVVFAICNHGCGHWMLRYLSQATFNDKGDVIDAGADLQDSWMSE